MLALVTEAYGGRGGIAQYCRDLLDALCMLPECAQLVVLPRRVSDSPEEVPGKINYRMQAAAGKWRYALELVRSMLDSSRYDLILCGHINLLPLAWLAKFLTGGRLVLLVYGIDVWQPHRNKWVRRLLPRVDAVISISRVTLDKLQDWAPITHIPAYILPNAINILRYQPGPKDPALVARYGLMGRTVLLTLGRLSASERYKGVDEIMEALPEIAHRLPNIAYLVAGDGDDRPRLQMKARELGITERVIFAGYISEDEKIAHFRLADAYVMPSHGEGFGFVFLEAMACGIPVVAGQVDGGREAVRNGLLGELVDPFDKEKLIAAILRAIAKSKVVPEGLAYFSYPEFLKQCHEIAHQIMQIEKISQ
ncbi:MAG: glycosyltransferase family 4 protein [Burkholderiales bacterium]